MSITVEQIAQTVNRLLDDPEKMVALAESLDRQEFFDMANQNAAEMTNIIAADMSRETGAPMLSVASAAHAAAVAHLALFMFAAGLQIKSEEFAVADNLTEEDIEAAIGQILGGSNG